MLSLSPCPVFCRLIFYKEDRDLIVIDKPAGLLTTHTKLQGRAARTAQPTAENFLNDYVRKGQARSSKRVYLVHRLDRETSGVMMFMKDERLAEAVRDRWNELTEKIYLARVEGRLSETRGVFESWLLEDADGYRVRSVKGPHGAGPRKPKLAANPCGSASCAQSGLRPSVGTPKYHGA